MVAARGRRLALSDFLDDAREHVPLPRPAIPYTRRVPDLVRAVGGGRRRDRRAARPDDRAVDSESHAVGEPGRIRPPERGPALAPPEEQGPAEQRHLVEQAGGGEGAAQAGPPLDP